MEESIQVMKLPGIHELLKGIDGCSAEQPPVRGSVGDINGLLNQNDNSFDGFASQHRIVRETSPCSNDEVGDSSSGGEDDQTLRTTAVRKAGLNTTKEIVKRSARKNKPHWTFYEDKKLKELVESYGVKQWRQLSEKFENKSGKQCRERWVNHLDPSIRKRRWTPREDAIILEKQKELGNRWSEISKFLEGRSENSVKNRYNAALKKKEGSSASSDSSS
uniref:Uncharacterized protein n=1 Tax=Timspurckia oligopyrenoides TaxID=708627 RepID=A0A7S0ZJK1_9RHOD|mmetsp:Transcript_7821/g.14196  ORF Transcript_7821/g.14196 Transcript_7821/m.14196 type:complete len:219 (+) Transcript_7821:336-992(+)